MQKPHVHSVSFKSYITIFINQQAQKNKPWTTDSQQASQFIIWRHRKWLFNWRTLIFLLSIFSVSCSARKIKLEKKSLQMLNKETKQVQYSCVPNLSILHIMIWTWARTTAVVLSYFWFTMQYISNIDMFWPYLLSSMVSKVNTKQYTCSFKYTNTCSFKTDSKCHWEE